MKDLRMIKMLFGSSEDVGEGTERPRKRRRVREKVRLDGKLVELAIVRASTEIVQYLVHDRGEFMILISPFLVERG